MDQLQDNLRLWKELESEEIVRGAGQGATPKNSSRKTLLPLGVGSAGSVGSGDGNAKVRAR